VFTAHPTEAVRRALLKKEREIVTCLVGDIDRGRTPAERRADRERIRLALTTSWQTAEAPSAKPSVADEFQHVGYYLSDVLYRVLPVFYEVFEDALHDTYGDAPVPDVLGFGSWVGGDMDGNPNVGAETITAALAGQRALVLAAYRRDLLALGEALSQSLTRVGVSDALLARIGYYLEHMPQAAAKLRPRHADMPYRKLLTFIYERLWATLHDEPEAYADAAAFEADIALIEDSLRTHRGEHAGGFAVRRLRRRRGLFRFPSRQPRPAPGLGHARRGHRGAARRRGLVGAQRGGAHAAPAPAAAGRAGFLARQRHFAIHPRSVPRRGGVAAALRRTRLRPLHHQHESQRRRCVGGAGARAHRRLRGACQ
jgi:phosphoenolpyruvate carboxylase